MDTGLQFFCTFHSMYIYQILLVILELLTLFF